MAPGSQSSDQKPSSSPQPSRNSSRAASPEKTSGADRNPSSPRPSRSGSRAASPDKAPKAEERISSSSRQSGSGSKAASPEQPPNAVKETKQLKARTPARNQWAKRLTVKRHVHHSMSDTSAHEVNEEAILKDGVVAKSRIKAGVRQNGVFFMDLTSNTQPADDKSYKLWKEKGKHVYKRWERRTHRKYTNMSGGGERIDPAFLYKALDKEHGLDRAESFTSSIHSDMSVESWASERVVKHTNQGLPLLAVETSRKTRKGDIEVQTDIRGCSNTEHSIAAGPFKMNNETKPTRIGARIVKHHGRTHVPRVKRPDSPGLLDRSIVSTMYA